MITKHCSFQKEEARAQEFVLIPLQVPFTFLSTPKIWTHTFLTGQQSEVHPSTEQGSWGEEGERVYGGKEGLGRHNGQMQQICLLEVHLQLNISQFCDH